MNPAATLLAQQSTSPLGASPLALALLVSALTLLPAVLLVGTSFVKVSVVLGAVRNALGTPHIPGSLVVLGLSVILTVHVMAPTASAVVRDAGPQWAEALSGDPTTPAGLARIARAWDAGRAPVVRFLRDNATPRDRALFLELAVQARDRQAHGDDTPRPTADDVSVLLPAFVVSELTRAFLIAFLVLLPFLVVDLVIAHVLLALGLTGLPPTTVSLPFKLLLFVMADGWYLLSRALVLGYR